LLGVNLRKLSVDQKIELKNILIDENSNYAITEVVQLIKELFGVEFSYKRVWVLIIVEFGLNYSKSKSFST